MAEQDVARYRVLAKIPFEGPIRLKKPQHTYLLLDHVADSTDSTPDHLYFGRELVPRAERGRELVGKGDLKRRMYLGPTSLDNEVALLMACFAHVKPGSLVRASCPFYLSSTRRPTHRFPFFTGPRPVRRHRLPPRGLRAIRRRVVRGHRH